MSEILFLAHRLPFPPDRGDKIRSHHVLRALVELAPVHVGCFAESAADLANEGELAALAKTHRLPLRRKPLAAAGLEAIARREPVSLAAFRDRQLAQWVAHTLERYPIETIYVFSGQMAQYVPAGWSGRLIADLVDVDSAKFEGYAAERSGPARWLFAREARLLRRVESTVAERADHTLLVSAPEAELLISRLPQGSLARVSVLGNGIDAEAFDPARVAPHPDLASPGPHLVFTGQLDYPPNVAAVLRAIERLLPLIRQRHPGATFHAVGRAPLPELSARDGIDGVRIWGEVPDVRPFLASADLALVPLMLARGVQNKVLEAMAMGRAVLLTPGAATGLPGRDGTHFRTAETDAELIARALELLDGPERAAQMGSAARRLMIEERSWAAMLAPLPELASGRRGPRSCTLAA